MTCISYKPSYLFEIRIPYTICNSWLFHSSPARAPNAQIAPVYKFSSNQTIRVSFPCVAAPFPCFFPNPLLFRRGSLDEPFSFLVFPHLMYKQSPFASLYSLPPYYSFRLNRRDAFFPFGHSSVRRVPVIAGIHSLALPDTFLSPEKIQVVALTARLLLGPVFRPKWSPRRFLYNSSPLLPFLMPKFLFPLFPPVVPLAPPASSGVSF